jgi:hypothetical protein
MVGDDNEGAAEAFDFFRPENALYARPQCDLTGLPQSHQHDPVMGTRLELRNILKIQILRDQEALAGLSRRPNRRIVAP